ncbi:hypothetical protein EVAR_4522_1 [Eumeta japonica]|uniref:Uncharacterized protein n=1 Tax=Eumeta variegata TaxID=151549 RepID=A0A4C1SVV2_EUMVA|nr:hypothetical protein EVAR_4522_1 [Eumeta japonica]
MRRQKMNLDPDLGDLEEMLAHVQNEIQREMEDQQDSKFASLTNVQESPKMVKRASSFNRHDERLVRAAPKPPLSRASSQLDSGSRSLNGDFKGSQNSLRSMHDLGSHSSLNRNGTSSENDAGPRFQSFRCENQRHSVLSLPDKGSVNAVNCRSKTATLPRGYGSSREKNWEDYWVQLTRQDDHAFNGKRTRSLFRPKGCCEIGEKGCANHRPERREIGNIHAPAPGLVHIPFGSGARVSIGGIGLETSHEESTFVGNTNWYDSDDIVPDGRILIQMLGVQHAAYNPSLALEPALLLPTLVHYIV